MQHVVTMVIFSGKDVDAKLNQGYLLVGYWNILFEREVIRYTLIDLAILWNGLINKIGTHLHVMCPLILHINLKRIFKELSCLLNLVILNVILKMKVFFYQFGVVVLSQIEQAAQICQNIWILKHQILNF